MGQRDGDLELVLVLSRIGRLDRELYRLLRAEAWDLAAKAHGTQTPKEREHWLRSAS